MDSMKRTLALTSALLTVALLGSACQSQTQPESAPDLPATYQLTADTGGSAFEGIGADEARGLFYVSEASGGEIHRGTSGKAQTQEWLGGDGTDGRTTARGITVDNEGRIYIAGGPNGIGNDRPDLWVYSADGRLLAALRAPGQEVFLNDVAIGPDGAAYFTNSNDPQIFRVADDGDQWQAELWSDGRGTIERRDGFNLGGIVLSEDGSAFVVAQGNTGLLWRFDTSSKAVTSVVGATGLNNADGLVLQGDSLTVVRNFDHLLTTLRLAADGNSVEPVREEPTAPDRVFTTAKPLRGQMLFVDSNFREEPPTGPFEVVTDPVVHPATAVAAPKANQIELDSKLRDAAWRNDVPAAKKLIEEGADVNAKDGTQQSAYLIATSEGYLELLRVTLANGASINDKDSYNGTGLIRAAERGHALIVGELLQAGIDRDHVNRTGYQAIHEAVWYGKDDTDYAATIRALAAGGVRLTDPSGSEGLTPVQMAQQRGLIGSERILTMLSTTTPPANPDAALLEAASAGDPDRVALALRAGANIEARDDRDRTALLLAVTNDHVESARLLVAMGADPNALDDQHDTPWLVTGVTGSVRMLETLLPANPNLTIENRFGGLSVVPASERGHVDYVRRVVQTGIDVNHVNDPGWTALLEAVVYGDGSRKYQEIVRILLAAGADRSIADRDGVTALQHAEAKGQTEIARILRAS